MHTILTTDKSTQPAKALVMQVLSVSRHGAKRSVTSTGVTVTVRGSSKIDELFGFLGGQLKNLGGLQEVINSMTQIIAECMTSNHNHYLQEGRLGSAEP